MAPGGPWGRPAREHPQGEHQAMLSLKLHQCQCRPYRRPARPGKKGWGAGGGVPSSRSKNNSLELFSPDQRASAKPTSLSSRIAHVLLETSLVPRTIKAQHTRSFPFHPGSTPHFWASPLHLQDRERPADEEGLIQNVLGFITPPTARSTWTSTFDLCALRLTLLGRL